MAEQFSQTSPPMPARPTMVLLNVYDLIRANSTTSWVGIGVFHSGVEVHGTEFAFGGHPEDGTGVWSMKPRQIEGATFRESVELGYTIFSPDDVTRIVNNLAREYRGNSYHLLTRNCNHFSNDLAKSLCGTPIPAYINRLAKAGTPLAYVKPLRKLFTFAPVTENKPAVPTAANARDGSEDQKAITTTGGDSRSWWQAKLDALKQKNREFAEARAARKQAAASSASTETADTPADNTSGEGSAQDVELVSSFDLGASEEAGADKS